MLALIGNIIWFLLGGLMLGLGWLLAGCLMFITIIGIPWSFACFRIGLFAFFPFGKKVVDRSEVTGKQDIGTGPFGMLANVIWFVLAGIWLAIGHLLAGLACALTIIGIPFLFQHLKLAQIALAPVGKTVVDADRVTGGAGGVGVPRIGE